MKKEERAEDRRKGSGKISQWSGQVRFECVHIVLTYGRFHCSNTFETLFQLLAKALVITTLNHLHSHHTTRHNKTTDIACQSVCVSELVS